MSRYLTPPKVGLLALISLYCESVIPSTATIPVLSFLVSQIVPVNAAVSRGEPSTADQKSVAAIEVFQKATIILVSGIPGRTVWDLLLKKLWDVNSLDALNVFFDGLSLLLEKSPEKQQKDAEEGIAPASNRMLLSRNSPLGAFVRRSQLEFTRLQIHDSVTLWKSFIKYREPTLPLWRKRNPTAGRNSFDTNLEDRNIGWGNALRKIAYSDFDDNPSKEAIVSTDDVEKLLEYQVDQMQKMGNRLPQGMKNRLRSIVESGVTVPSLSHYVEFLDSWKAGDYPSSFDNLHRYFDYTMHNRDRTFYQYALLNLAILQADFGCFSEALAAMQETISTARENNDMACLNYSLSWLYHFGKAHPSQMDEIRGRGILGIEKEALAFLKSKAKETSMWSLLSTSLLSEARLTLSKGESVASAFESVVKSSHLNVTKNLVNTIGSQMMMQSSIYGRIGVSCQAWLYGELFTQCYSTHSPVEDVMNSLCRGAFLLAQRGRYTEAISRMDDADQETLRTLKYQQYWTTNLGILKMQRHLHRDNLIAADHVLCQLRAIPTMGQDTSFSITILEIDLHIRRQDYPTAMSVLECLATKLDEEEADILQRVKLMILKARVYDRAGIPQKGFSVALRAATLAQSARIMPILWEAICAISRILISLREFEAAAKLLSAVLPQVFECEDCDLAGHSFSLLADAHMGMAGQASADTLQRKEHLTKALECIDRSFDEFSRLGDIRGQCEMMAKKATIMHLNGDPVLANDCAAKYLDIKRAAKED